MWKLLLLLLLLLLFIATTVLPNCFHAKLFSEMSVLSTLRSLSTNREDLNERVKNSINSKLEALMYSTPDGDLVPNVCICCDKYVVPNEFTLVRPSLLSAHRKLFAADIHDPINDPELLACYKYDGKKRQPWMEQALLSPRAHYVPAMNGRKLSGYTACKHCKISISKHIVPKHAISNNNAYGTPPKCLEELTEVELAILTPVKTH